VRTATASWAGSARAAGR